MEALRPEISAGGFDRYDGTMQFYHRVNALLMPDFTVVDFGAGRGVNHIEDQIKYRRELQDPKFRCRTIRSISFSRISPLSILVIRLPLRGVSTAYSSRVGGFARAPPIVSDT